MSTADRYLVAGALLVAVLFAALAYCRTFASRNGTGCYAVIMVQGKRVGILGLSDGTPRELRRLYGKQGPATVEVVGKKIRMLQAPCPDRICVRRGWIEKPGDSIVCIPNEIHIFITAKGPAAVDALTR